MGTDIEHLAARISASPGPDSAYAALAVAALLQLLALSEPVTIHDLTTAAGCTADELSQALGRLPDTEYNDQSCIVGHGITLRPTPNHFQAGGRQ